MRNLVYIPYRGTIFLLVLLTALSQSAKGQLTLVGPSVRNGSFEEGILAPWSSVDSTISHDPSFASDGDWFAFISDTPISPVTQLRPSIFNRVTAVPEDGLTFMVTFDAKNAAAGFDGVRIFFNARNSDETTVFAQNLLFDFASPNTSTWQPFETQFQVPSTWIGGQITLGLQFEKLDPVVGTTYTGYLDNVVLQQVPEPAAWTLLAGGLCAACLAMRRFRKGRPLF